MNTNTVLKSRMLGFSLIEMAIVLFIVALLLGGLLPTVSSQIEQQRVSETRKQIDEIQQALIGYAIVNGRLPGPAVATIVTGALNAGIANNALPNGVIPWVTLGIKETDAWGHRFTYAVTGTFVTANFTISTPGNLTIKSADTGGNNIATTIPAVIVSHGTNGLGAYTSAGIQVPPVPAAATDEGDNTDSDTDFVSHENTSTFDDIVVWISPNILINKMVSAGKLP